MKLLTANWLRSTLVLLALASGCAEKLEGPKPSLPKVTKKAGPVDPRIVCNAQHASEVTLHGGDLSPVPIDIPHDPKVALPTITLTRAHETDGSKVGTPDVIVWSGDSDADPQNAFAADGKTPLLTWKSQTEMSFTVEPELTLGESKKGMLPAGVYDVSAKNANGTLSVSVGALAVVDKPALTDIAPSIVCLQQAAKTIDLTGTSLLGLDGEVPTITVDGIAQPLPLILPECTAVDHDGIDAKLCTTAKVELPKGALEDGYAALQITNPETAACHSEEDIKVRVVPSPVIDSVKEPLACLAQGARTFVISGKGFLKIDDVLPAISVGGVDVKVSAPDMGDCEDLPTLHHEVSTCSKIEITLADGALKPGLHALVLQNPAPADCSATAEGAVRIVAPPKVSEVVPQLACLDDDSVAVDVRGEDFLVIDGVEPKVTVDGMELDAKNVAPADCDALSGVPDLNMDGKADKDVKVCATLTLTLAQGSVALGKPAVSVENPAPAGCKDEQPGLLTIIPGPAITSVTPALACTDDHSQPITIEGTGFVATKEGDAADELPSVSVGGMSVTVTGVDGCSAAQDANGLAFRSCTKVLATLAQGQLVSTALDGRPIVIVTNPAPAGCAAASSDDLVIPPTLAITSLTPASACEGASGGQAVIASGTGFLIVDGALPVVSVNNVAQTLAEGDFGSCASFTVPGFTSVKSCQTVALSIDVTGLSAGTTLPVSITNPAPADCAATATMDYLIVGPPMVTSVVPSNVCSDVPETLTITGSNFAASAEVLVGTDCGAASPTNCMTASNIVVNSAGTSITADFAGLESGVYDVTVRNAASCEATFGTHLTVHPTPLVFFVDPLVVYNELSIDATVFTANLSVGSPLDKVELIGPDPSSNGSPATTELTVVDNAKANRIKVNIPGLDGGNAPTFPAGKYTVRVTSTLGCAGELTEGLTLTNTLDGALLTGIDPSYVSSSTPTAVTITGAGFTSIPRVYINPSGGTGTAIALRGVELSSATQLTAVVPDLGAGGVGTYDVILVNPNGKVDVLADGLTISGNPPVISSVVPGSLPANSTGTITLSGSGFEKAGVQVELDCLQGTTQTTVAASSAVISGGAGAFGDTATVTLSLSSGTPSAPSAGSACVVRLINMTDGSFYEYSALSVTNSSLNLAAWTTSSKTLVHARRGLSLLAGRPTGTSRFLYAIGGDTGVASMPAARGTTVYDSVESASVDVFGTIGDFAEQANKLPAPRTAAGAATIGSFVYLVGGHDGASATNTLYRAKILDPLAGPEIDDLDATLGDGTLGLSGGLYYYRVAAIYPSDDASNPGGESAPGEVLPVQLPNRDEKIVLSLTWQATANAHGYRVYRSPVAGGSVAQMELIHEQTCGTLATDVCDCGTTPTDCQYEDDASSAPNGKKAMPAGSLGVWHVVDGARCTGTCTLATAREAHATVAVKDATTPGKYFLYAIGGRNGATYLDTYEVTTVTVAGDGSQTVSGWTAGSDTLATPRAELGAWVLDAQNSNLLRSDPDNAYSGASTDTWIYLGGGRTTGAAGDANVEAAKVGANGDLGTLQDSSDFSGTHAGYGTGVANDQLYRFGPSATGASAGLCKKQGSNIVCDVPPPGLQSGAWNALGSASTNRLYMGTAQESAFFFVAGGHDGANTLSSVERTVQ